MESSEVLTDCAGVVVVLWWWRNVAGEGSVVESFGVRGEGQTPTHNLVQDTNSSVWLRGNETLSTVIHNLKARISV